MSTENPRPGRLKQLKQFETPSPWRATRQAVNSAVSHAAIVLLMYFTMQWGFPVWATILLAIPAAAFLVRMFIIFHDCGHGSFFKSQTANPIVGTAMGVLTFTSFGYWRYGHGIHYSSSGNLDRRTISEFYAAAADKALLSGVIAAHQPAGDRSGCWWRRLR